MRFFTPTGSKMPPCVVDLGLQFGNGLVQFFEHVGILYSFPASGIGPATLRGEAGGSGFGEDALY
jgi:hypothetical protein